MQSKQISIRKSTLTTIKKVALLASKTNNIQPERQITLAGLRHPFHLCSVRVLQQSAILNRPQDDYSRATDRGTASHSSAEYAENKGECACD